MLYLCVYVSQTHTVLIDTALFELFGFIWEWKYHLKSHKS